MALTLPLRAIGVVRSRYTDTEYTPIQARLNSGEDAAIELGEQYTEGLEGLENFDYAWLITWLHNPREEAAAPSLLHIPFLLRKQQRRMGIFATRGPRRVNPIGLSLVRIVDVAGPVIRFAGVDLIDGTPVLDIKPYVTRFDRPPGEPSCGWFDEITISDGSTPAGPPPPEGAQPG